MLRTRTRRAITVTAVAAVACLTGTALPAAADPPAGIYPLVYLPAPGGVSFRQYDEIIKEPSIVVWRDYMCTSDDFDTDRWQQLETELHRYPGWYGTPEAEKKPFEEARIDLFGVPTLSNANRHQLCNDPALMASYNAAQLRHIEADGFTYQPEYADTEEGNDNLRNMWTKKCASYRVILKIRPGDPGC
ncbi:hypothetical protein ABZ721_40875 [Streptomyces sp. NPDC006733]|uniref:hypothetical protein n=1 Tax=Streptomyces sp. NPDC006733 TaxID=3155460 RepID=UPI0033DDC73D